MPRKLSNVPVPKWESPKFQDELKLHLKVVTSMFGGGFKAREVDPVCVIRPAAIRGQLRFWWRATAGASYPSPKDLFEAEKKIWGSTEAPGVVTVMSKLIAPGEEKKHSELAPKEISKYGPREGYFIFPFQAQKKEQIPQATARKGVKFELQLLLRKRWDVDTKQYEKEVESIKNAVKAWVTFGGVGARTRRGCGALQVIGNNANEWLPPNRDEESIGFWMKSLKVGNVASTTHTHLKDATIIVGKECKADNDLTASDVAWRTLGTFWARFRKGHIPPVRSNYDPTSHCDWDDYRQVLVKNYFSKSPRPKLLAIAKPFFGLPIIYQKFDNAPYTKFTIEASETGRMSSPVILKPIVFADGSVCPMVVILSAPKPDKVAIDKEKVDLKVPTSDKVLDALRVKDPLQAITTAAKKIWGSSNVIEVKL